ncbi:MAG: DUF2911 domain-containing protein [Gemmatimonadales bacterium]
MIIRIAALAALAVPCLLSAQVRASEAGTVSQMIDGTKITIEYSRPRARGRSTLFGTKAVHWNETWTPGANWATTLDVNKNVKLNGKPVAKGKYSVWMVVRQNGNWTVVLDPESHIYHMNPPDSSSTQVRIPVHVEAVPFTEVLTWSMPDIRMNGGTLAMQWERARVAMNVEVEPSLAMTLPSSDATPYLGRYKWVEKDSATAKDSVVSEVAITHESGTLRGRFTPEDKYLKKFALIRVAPDWLAVGVYDEKGDIYEVLKPDMVFEFARANGVITGFAVRDSDDNVWAKGTRIR